MGNRKDGILVSLGAALAGVVSGAVPTGLLIANAEARVLPPLVRRREEEPNLEERLLVVAPRDDGETLIAGHSSHRSHRSHSSHYSGGGGGGRSRYVPSYEAPAYEPPPRPPKPAVVSFVAVPGGSIFIDGKQVGSDATRSLKLTPGKHTVRIENRFLGEYTTEVELAEGQTGTVEIQW